MENIDTLILAAGFLGAFAIIATTIAPRLGVPLLLVFLVVGMLAGEDGPGRIPFSNYWLANLAGITALCVILFDGGLKTHPEDFRLGLKPGAALATLGVFVTCAGTAAIAYCVLPLSLLESLLLGAVVSSTDAAAVFSMLGGSGVQVNHRVRAVLEMESGANDPMAVVLTIGLIQALQSDQAITALEPLRLLLVQLGGGALMGVIGGYGVAFLLQHLRLPEPLYPVLALCGSLAIFGATATMGGSGFLAAYVAGLTVARLRVRQHSAVLRFHDGIAWMAQVGLFLILGLLATPHELLDLALPALAISGVLIFVARPLAVILCLAPLRFKFKEQLFIAWVGLRGSVPVVLATYPLMAGLPAARIIFDVAFFLVLISLLLQGSTVGPMATLLGLRLPVTSSILHRTEFDLPGQSGWEIVSYRVDPGTLADGKTTKQLPLPDASRAICLVRNGALLPYVQWGRLRSDDHISLLVKESELPQIDLIFERPTPKKTREHDAFFGVFHLDPKASALALVDVYNLPAHIVKPKESIGELLQRMLPQPVEGDRLRLGEVELTIRRMTGGLIADVGLRLRVKPLPD